MSRVGVAAALVAALAGAGCGDQASGQRALRPATSPASPPAPARVAGPPAVVPGRGYVAAYLRGATWLRASPGGRPLARVRARTQFGSARVFSVVGRRGRWVGVVAPELRNGRVGWLDARRITSLYRVPYEIEIQRARRLMVVKRLARPVLAVHVAVGRPSAPTPLGRYAVSDRLTTGTPSGPYGCCILALTGHQTVPLAGWTGGDRLAIHATPSPETIGQAVSHGCVRALNPVMRRLVHRIPLGTPVRILR